MIKYHYSRRGVDCKPFRTSEISPFFPILSMHFAKGGRAPMVPFPLSRSPHPSSGPFPTYRKPARPAPPGRAAQRLAKRLRCSGLPRGRFYFLPAAPVPARCNPFCFWRRGSFCAAAPAYPPAGSFPFLAAPFRPPPPKKARRGARLPSQRASPKGRRCPQKRRTHPWTFPR